MSWDWEHTSKAEQEANRKREIEERRADGEAMEPVVPTVKRGIPAETFWGKSWGSNLEAYSDYENRIPRGRAYLRKGLVMDLKITDCNVEAQVAGQEIYDVIIDIDPLDPERWKAIRKKTGGEIDSVVDLLSGKIGDHVMEAMTDLEEGIFPEPSEIQFNCSCPDWADMCKHIAATLYGVGVILDTHPEKLFELRGVDHHELLQAATEGVADLTDHQSDSLKPEDLSEIFGIEIVDPECAFLDVSAQKTP